VCVNKDVLTLYFFRRTILLRIYDQKYLSSHFCLNMQPSPFILLFLVADTRFWHRWIYYLQVQCNWITVSALYYSELERPFLVNITKCQFWTVSVSTYTFLHLCALPQAVNCRNLYPVSAVRSSLEAYTSWIGIVEYSRCHHVAGDPLTT
jgi:hypothetical protein